MLDKYRITFSCDDSLTGSVHVYQVYAEDSKSAQEVSRSLRQYGYAVDCMVWTIYQDYSGYYPTGY